MLSSVLILVFCLAALAYWLRLTVVTILDRPRLVEEALRLAEANRLEFPLVKSALQQSAAQGDYGRMAESLRHDFLAITYLLRFAATIKVGEYSREERLLVADFHLMRLVFHIGGTFSPRLARFALQEMTSVLEHFSSVMSERMSAFAADMVRA
jgi:hypothetical protein